MRLRVQLAAPVERQGRAPITALEVRPLTVAALFRLEREAAEAGTPEASQMQAARCVDQDGGPVLAAELVNLWVGDFKAVNAAMEAQDAEMRTFRHKHDGHSQGGVGAREGDGLESR